MMRVALCVLAVAVATVLCLPALAEEAEGTSDAWAWSEPSVSLFATGDPSGEGHNSEVILYGWLAGMDGTVGVGPIEGEVDASFSDILDQLDAVLAVYYETWGEEAGFYLDAMYVRLSDEVDLRVRTLDYEIEQTLIEAGALLQRGSAERPMDVIIGVRYMDLGADLTLTPIPPGGSASGGEHWLDPIVGARWRRPLSDKWGFGFRADIGGFGIGSDLSWQLLADFRYQLSPLWKLDLAYRYLDVDYEEDDFTYDVAMYGPQVGIAYCW
jgi:hypothetical protein